MHFLPFNPVDKRTAITYIDENGDWHRSSKGAPEQVMTLKMLIYYECNVLYDFLFTNLTLIFFLLLLIRSLNFAISKERRKEKLMKLSMVLLNVGFDPLVLLNKYAIEIFIHIKIFKIYGFLLIIFNSNADCA